MSQDEVDKDATNKLVKLMVTSEEKVVSDFNRIFMTTFPNVNSVAKSPFKTAVLITDNKYYTDAISCFDMMLERLTSLESTGMFELAYQKYTIDKAFMAFRE